MSGLGPRMKFTNSAMRFIVIIIISILMVSSSIVIFTPTTLSQKGGPDSFGYRWIDSNATAPSISYNWLDGVSGSTDLNFGNDQNSGYINLGFKFPFYSISYSSIAICSNGWATFSDSGYITANGNPIPSSVHPNGLIAPFWIDLNPAIHGNVTYKRNLASSPNNFIISWNSVPLNDGKYKYNQTFQAVIYENGSVLFQYKSINLTKQFFPTIGIEDPYGNIGLPYSTGSITNQSAVWFYFYYPEHDLGVKSVSVKKYGIINKNLEVKSTIQNLGFKDENTVNVTLKVNSIAVNWKHNYSVI